MKRPLPRGIQHEDETMRIKKGTKPSYQETLWALDQAIDFTTDQIANLAKKINEVYCLKVNKITQTFPSDLWNQIFLKSFLPETPIACLELRLVSRHWNNVICSIPKLDTIQSYSINVPRLLNVFTSLKSLKVTSVGLPAFCDFSRLTGLRHLHLYQKLSGGRARWSPDLTEFTPLTGLTKLTLSAPGVTSLGPLTNIHCLSLKHPVGLCRPEIDGLPYLTRLVSESKDIFTHGKGVYKFNHEHYDGEWKDGCFHGHGMLRTCVNDFSWDMYVGDFEDGYYQGHGVYTWENGGRYEGEFYKDEFHGHGMKQDQAGCFVGQWKHHLKEEGTMTFTDGTQFVGLWKEGERWKGTMTYAKGHKYEGSMNDRGPHGEGTMIFPNGEKYEGSWANGKRCGRGINFYPNGQVQDCEWFNGLPNGEGSQIYANGNKFVGIFKDGKKHGPGVYYFARAHDVQFIEKNSGEVVPYGNGDRFEGEWMQDKRSDDGVLVRANEDRFEGHWQKVLLSPLNGLKTNPMK